MAPNYRRIALEKTLSSEIICLFLFIAKGSGYLRNLKNMALAVNINDLLNKQEIL